MADDEAPPEWVRAIKGELGCLSNALKGRLVSSLTKVKLLHKRAFIAHMKNKEGYTGKSALRKVCFRMLLPHNLFAEYHFRHVKIIRISLNDGFTRARC